MTGCTARVVPAAAVLVALAACAPPDSEPAANSLTGTPYEVTATVVEAPEHGPRLCNGVLDSYPPQCGGGPEIVGWDWDAVESESADGTTWGEYHVIGTWDGQVLTMTEPARPPDPAWPEPALPDFTSPCPEPEGGWRPVDPATATVEAQDLALTRAAEAPDYAGAWLDQSYLDELDIDRDDPAAIEGAANDPARLVLNLKFTGDLAERERWIREVWGGALCVSPAEHTVQELADIQQRLHTDFPDLLSSGPDVLGNTVTAMVTVVTPDLQRNMDVRYGAGVVVLEGWLTPVE